MNMVHLTVVPDDRRQRARDAKRQRILLATGAVIDREGLAGVTMQAVADELDCAVGTLYTAFASKAALLSALQAEAVATLEASYRQARIGWEEHLDGEDLEDDLVVLVELLAYGGFLAAAGVVFPDEIALVRALLGEAGPTAAPLERASGRELLPVVHRFLDPPSSRLAEAVEAGVLEADESDVRALRWVTGSLGVLRLERLAPMDRHLFRAAALARSLTEDLLVGWGQRARTSRWRRPGSNASRLVARWPLHRSDGGATTRR